MLGFADTSVLDTLKLLVCYTGKLHIVPTSVPSVYTGQLLEFPVAAAVSSVLAGEYNEEAFAALDKIIDDASKSGVKLILALNDNWHLQDGLFQYVEWGNSMGTGDFFTDPNIIQLFKDHIATVVNRTNTLNGRQYKDEPAIFAWDLINELRDGCNTSAPNATCDPSFTGSVQARALPLLWASPHASCEEMVLLSVSGRGKCFSQIVVMQHSSPS